MYNRDIRKENKRLEKQLAIARDELQTIKGSKAFKMIRLAGHARNQIKQSPVGFVKKVVQKASSGALLRNGRRLQKTVLSDDSLRAQYKEWIALNEPDDTELEGQTIASEAFQKKPLISIITPVFNPPADVFVELIESVLAQTYPNFELCLGDFGDNATVKAIIERYAKKDSRIKALPSAENLGIAGNSNQILATAQGEYIALLDHDDTLSRDALYENVKLINEDNYDFIYSDKDKINEAGERFEPFFKAGWSPETMLNANYLTHLNVMKTSVVKKVGGWDSETDGAQDWDLFLKVVAASKKIGHIQKVLYHWRVIATSTALSIETKPYALEGQRRAVDKYLDKMHIPAKSYHVGAELLLNWNPAKRKTVCIVRSNSSTHLRTFLDDLALIPENDALAFVVMHHYTYDASIEQRSDLSFVGYKQDMYLHAVGKALSSYKDEYVLFFDDRLSFRLNEQTLRNLTGWLDVEGVVAAGPRLVDTKGFALGCGASITKEGAKPLFVGSPPYHQTALGNIEWIRDLTLLNPFTFVSIVNRVRGAIDAFTEIGIPDGQVSLALQLVLSRQGRLVFNPKVTIMQAHYASVDPFEDYEELDPVIKQLDVKDPYLNANLSDDNPMELVSVVQSNEAEDLPEAEYAYQLEASAHAAARTLTHDMIVKNRAVINKENSHRLEAIHSVLILLPDFYGIYAGLNNIFSYADAMRKKGADIKFGLMSADTHFMRQRTLISEKFPVLGEKAEIFAVSNETIENVAHVDITVCTQWATAYLLARFNKTYRKCYFIQDKEASFYPKGTISALVENTYRLGFFGLANTPGLLEWYKEEYGGDGVVIKSIVDLSKYSPSKEIKVAPRAPYKIFFYARPNEPRNAFELGAAALVKLKNSLGDKVDIYAAGADWNPESYGLDNILVNLGKISYEKLPAFYRSMDVGLMFMFSGHPGVVASELMASGCPVVVNEYDDTTWSDLYQHEMTCLVSVPTADEVARNLQRCLEDVALREVIIKGGKAKVDDFYAHYDESIERAYKALLTAQPGH